MNAPWKPGGGSRDPFAAFLCDETSLDVLRGVVSDMGWQSEKCAKGGLRHAIQSLSIAASPSILMVDLSESGDPLSDINALAEVCEPGTVVIAIGQVNDVRLYRDLLSSGIHDYLLKPLGPDQLRDAIAHAQATFSNPKTAEANAARRHITTAFVGTRGGVGASMLATSVAWLFSTDHKMPTALLDLDVHFGTGALALDLEPGRGLTDAIDNPSRIDGLFIERAMIRANDNLAILSAEAPISQPLMTDGAAFMQLQEEFRQAFDMTVVDLPRNMLINFPHLLSEVNVVVLTTELTLASARDAIRLLSWLKANAPHAHPLVVVNKVNNSVVEISKADFEATIERKVDLMVQLDSKGAAAAAKLGQTFVEANRSSKSAAVVRELTSKIIHSGEESTAETISLSKNGDVVKKSLLSKLSLKSLMPSKQKTEA